MCATEIDRLRFKRLCSISREVIIGLFSLTMPLPDGRHLGNEPLPLFGFLHVPGFAPSRVHMLHGLSSLTTCKYTTCMSWEGKLLLHHVQSGWFSKCLERFPQVLCISSFLYSIYLEPKEISSSGKKEVPAVRNFSWLVEQHVVVLWSHWKS